MQDRTRAVTGIHSKVPDGFRNLFRLPHSTQRNPAEDAGFDFVG
jgi:hypothetical protein